MADRSLKFFVGENRLPVKDYTDYAVWSDMELSMSGFGFQSSPSTIPLRDEGDTLAVPQRNVTEVKLGSNFIYRGRVSPVTYQRDPFRSDRDRILTAHTDDYNKDLEGIDIPELVCPEETDVARVQRVIALYLSGNPRLTTNLNGSNYVSGSNLVTLSAKTYTQTNPQRVLQEILAETNKDGFVDVDGNVHYDGIDSTAFTCPYYITDRLDELRADPTHALAVEWDTGPAVRLEGAHLTSEVRVYYSGTNYRSATNGLVETNHAYWVEPFYIDGINSAQAQAIANTLAARRAFPGRTYMGSLYQWDGTPLPDEMVGSIKAGMQIRIKARVTPDAQDAYLIRRIAKLTWTSPNPKQWIAHVELERPLLTTPRSPGPLGPQPPTPPTEGACTRLYFIEGNSAVGPTMDAAWNSDSAGNSHNQETLAAVHADTYSATDKSESTGAGGGTDIRLGQFSIEMDAALAAVLAAGGAEFKMQARCRSRSGIGISEASQDDIAQVGLRVTQGATNTIRGTALALHNLATSTGSTKFRANTTPQNRVFPPAAATNTLSAVSGAAAGDYLVLEVGYRSFTVGVGGAAIFFRDATGVADLPEDELDTTALNPWIEICSTGSTGDTTQPTVNPGDESPGTPGCTTYACIDHSHAHGFHADDGVHMHDAEQIAGLSDPPEIEGFVTTTAGGQHEYFDHGATGSTETIDLADGNVHDVTLNASCTFTFSGATSGVECRFRLLMRQDATGSRVPTFPTSVVWPDDTEPTWSTAADAVDVVEFLTVDGGTTWFGDAGGTGGGATALDDLTDVTITSATNLDALRYNGSAWVNDARIWRPVMDGAGNVVTDGGTGEAIMALS